MKEFLQRNFLVVFLAFLVMVLVVLKVIYGNTEENKGNITPTITPEPTVVIIKDISDPSDE